MMENPLLPLKYETWLLQMGLSLSENIHRHIGKNSVCYVVSVFFCIPAPEKTSEREKERERENIVQNK